MSSLGRIFFNSLSNKISFLFLGSKSVVINPTALIPAGAILPNATSEVPFGFLSCDGRAVSKSTYPKLFSQISTAYGDGTKNPDGSSSPFTSGQGFNLPDLRGRFLRGVDGSANRDFNKGTRISSNVGGNVGNNVGSVQSISTAINGLGFNNSTAATSGMNQNSQHKHDANASSSGGYVLGHSAAVGTTAWLVIAADPSAAIGYWLTPTINSVNLDHTHDVTPSVSIGSGDSETRPVNVYVEYIIKI